MRAISLGWGIQSFTLTAMSALGKLPPVDVAIHADTGYERLHTYLFAGKWTPWLEEHNVKIITVQASEDRRKVYRPDVKAIMVPAYTTYPDGTPSGMLPRQCTEDWKVKPIRRWLQKHRNGETVQMWLGITLDEATRMRDSGVKYLVNVYPFIQDIDAELSFGERFKFRLDPMTRSDCIRWLIAHNLDVPGKSSCIFCPFRDRNAWREMQQSSIEDWKRAVMIDEQIRRKKSGYVCYFTRDLKPLTECDFSNQEDHGQLTLWEEGECSGNCFL